MFDSTDHFEFESPEAITLLCMYMFFHLPFVLTSILLMVIYISMVNREITYNNQIKKRNPEKKYGIIKSGSGNMCSICIDTLYDEDLVRQLNCSHVYHTECIDEWILRNTSCPLCRIELNGKGIFDMKI